MDKNDGLRLPDSKINQVLPTKLSAFSVKSVWPPIPSLMLSSPKVPFRPINCKILIPNSPIESNHKINGNIIFITFLHIASELNCQTYIF